MDASTKTFSMGSPQMRPKMMNFIASGNTGLAEKFTCLCVADTAGSLDGTYFTFSSLTTNYYVWMDVDAGGNDPAIAGKTGVPVSISSGDADTVVAAAVQAAIDALAGVTATVGTTTVTVVLDSVGSVTNVAQGAVTTGFTLTTTVNGVDPTFALSFGKFDAVMTSSALGDYTITFNDIFIQAPQVAVLPVTDQRSVEIFSCTTSAVRLKFKDAAGAAADADFHLMVIGSMAADSMRQL